MLLYLSPTANVMTHCQWFVNDLDINVKTNTIFLKWIKFINIVVTEYLIFESILWGDLTGQQYLLTHILITRARLEWKFPELPTIFAQL